MLLNLSPWRGEAEGGDGELDDFVAGLRARGPQLRPRARGAPWAAPVVVGSRVFLRVPGGGGGFGGGGLTGNRMEDRTYIRFGGCPIPILTHTWLFPAM